MIEEKEIIAIIQYTLDYINEGWLNPKADRIAKKFIANISEVKIQEKENKICNHRAFHFGCTCNKRNEGVCRYLENYTDCEFYVPRNRI
jgi:hypothetical protein